MQLAAVRPHQMRVLAAGICDVEGDPVPLRRRAGTQFRARRRGQSRETTAAKVESPDVATPASRRLEEHTLAVRRPTATSIPYLSGRQLRAAGEVGHWRRR